MRGDVLGPNQSFIWPGIFSSPPREKISIYVGKYKAGIPSCLSFVSSFFYSCVSLADLAARYQNVSWLVKVKKNFKCLLGGLGVSIHLLFLDSP